VIIPQGNDNGLYDLAFSGQLFENVSHVALNLADNVLRTAALQIAAIISEMIFSLFSRENHYSNQTKSQNYVSIR